MTDMKAVTLKAHYDGKQICLDEPYPLRPDSQLVVTILSEPNEAPDEDRQAWYALGRRSLARAYGADEPDYSDCIGKRPPE